MFIPNQKVICIDANIPPQWWEFVHPLKQDGLYTIRDIVRGTKGQEDMEEVAVYLHEIHNSINSHGIERGYSAERFAPLKEQEQEQVEDDRSWQPDRAYQAQYAYASVSHD